MSLIGAEQKLRCSSETERQEEGRSQGPGTGAQNMRLLWDCLSHSNWAVAGAQGLPQGPPSRR